MLGFNLSVGRNRQSFGDADAQAFIAATGLTGTTETTAVRRLVANLKTYGLWSKMKAIYPFVSDTINLVSYSEDFSNAVWTKQEITISANSTTAPDGTMTADKCIPTTLSSTHQISSSALVASSTCAFGVYAKAGGYNTIHILDRALASNGAIFDLSAGTVTNVGSGVGTITSVGNGWYRCMVVATTTGIRFYIPSTNGAFVGDGTSGVYLWGAQLEQSASATTYQPIATTPANRFASQFKYNLKDPRDLDAAFRLAFNGTWTYSQQGATPNGVNAYADTFLNMASVLTNNNNHMSFYSRTNSPGALPTNYKMEMGVTDNTTHSNQISPNYTGTNALFENGSTVVAVANGNTTGMYIGSATSSTNGKLYKNNTVLGSSTTLNTYSLYSNKIYLSASTLSTTNTAVYYSNREKAFTTIGDGLTDTEATNLYTSVQLFQQDLSRQVGVPIVSDSDAQSFLNAAVITDTTQANAINTLVVGLKNASLWTKMKAIYPFVGGTATTHKWNLKDPRDLDAAYRLAFSGAWTHSSTGALPNGANAYADSFLIPSTALTLNNTVFGYYSRTNSSQSPSATEMAVGTSGTQLMYLRTKNSSGNAEGYSYNTNPATVSNANSQGFYIVSRTSNSDLRLYKNNSNIASLLTTQTGTLPSNKFAIGAVNYGGTIGEYSNKECALAFIGDGINSTEATTLNTLVTNFETTLNRNV